MSAPAVIASSGAPSSAPNMAQFVLIYVKIFGTDVDQSTIQVSRFES